MGNEVYFQPTKFVDTRTDIVTFGFRAYDDYDNTYCNLWDNIPDDDMEFLKRVLLNADETIRGFIDFMQEYGKGAYIGDTYYELEEIKHLLPNE